MTDTDSHETTTEARTVDNVVKLPATPQESPQRKIANFVHDHPVVTIAGGLALGALAAALIPKRNRAYVTKRTSQWADAVSAATVALAQQALERAEAASSQVQNRADAIADRAGDIGHAAIDRIGKIGGTTANRAQRLIDRTTPEPSVGEKLAQSAARIISRLHR